MLSFLWIDPINFLELKTDGVEAVTPRRLRAEQTLVFICSGSPRFKTEARL